MFGLGLAGILAGCASSSDIADKDTLNERSERLAHMEDRLPPNPNRPPDNRELKASPTVVQGDAAFNKPEDERDDKGLAVNAGPDQHVRPQDPTQSEESPKAVGGPAGQSQKGGASNGDLSLAQRVKETFAASRVGTESNLDPQRGVETVQGVKSMDNVEVTAKNGIVTLTGSVPSETERTAWEQAASRAPGVVSVSNQLVVTKIEKQ